MSSPLHIFWYCITPCFSIRAEGSHTVISVTPNVDLAWPTGQHQIHTDTLIHFLYKFFLNSRSCVADFFTWTLWGDDDASIFRLVMLFRKWPNTGMIRATLSSRPRADESLF